MQHKVVGYVRVNGGDESGLYHQVLRLQNAGVVDVLIDVVSGVSEERAGLNCLMALIEADQVEEVVVTRVDRLSRSLLQLRQIIGVLQGKNIRLKTLI